MFLLGIFILFNSFIAHSFDNRMSVKSQEALSSTVLFSKSSLDSYINPDTLTTLKADSASIYKDLAFLYAKSNESELACFFIEKHIRINLDLSFLKHANFERIKDSPYFKKLEDKYSKKISFWAVFCLYTGFIGIFMSIVLNLRKRSDKIGNFLMSAFLLLHSIFIIHVCLLLTNYRFYIPHNLYASTSFSFLYGPLIYFYFKRITTEYKFKYIDLLHLLPTFLLIVFLLLPIYMLPQEEKLRMMLNRSTSRMSVISNLITIIKLISLLIYGILVIQTFIRHTRHNKQIPRIEYTWQRNIVIFCSFYIVTYMIYSFLIISHTLSGFFFNFKVATMASLVLYVSYVAYVQPSIFGKLVVVRDEPKPKLREAGKYEKSGLTPSLSMELKTRLLYLLHEDKIYRQNDITLQKLSELLNTTRHNTSQIVNEHFGLNFFELINKYRIEEAKELLKNKKYRGHAIIDIAYEVGFNNKVTFNKSFKKYNQITPSEYMKLFVA